MVRTCFASGKPAIWMTVAVTADCAGVVSAQHSVSRDAGGMSGWRFCLCIGHSALGACTQVQTMSCAASSADAADAITGGTVAMADWQTSSAVATAANRERIMRLPLLSQNAHAANASPLPPQTHRSPKW
jgi:hypothetical protein